MSSREPGRDAITDQAAKQRIHADQARGCLRGGVLSWVLALGMLSTAVQAQEDEDDLAGRLSALEAIILEQRAEIEAQREAMERTIQRQQQQLDAQYELIQQLQTQQLGAKAPASPPPDAAPDVEVAATTEAAAEPSKGSDEASAGQQAAEAELQRRIAAGEGRREVDAQATLYDPSNTAFDPNFPGAWHLPGKAAAMRIGGFVNLGLVTSFDPVLNSDRFIVGGIPPDGETVAGARSGTDVTVRQSRLNFEVREQTEAGALRAFLEGDFEGSDSAFRLRHAFGQYRYLLAGQTWSTFANVNALPEEVDFEGVNGVVLRRQPQLRVFPEFGKDFSFVFSIEEPGTDVANGTGNKGNWDVIVTVDRLDLGELGGWNYRVSAILRDLEGQLESDGGQNPDSEVRQSRTTGWGITTSGRTSLGDEDEDAFLLWQLTYGKGIGRYLNDLSTVGGGDAVFDPNGDLRALPVFAGFISYRNQWDDKPWLLKDLPGFLRSNVTLSWISVDNYDFQADKDYSETWRASANLLYFPTQNLRFGGELLWGRRENKDGSKGTAAQVQLSARYNF